ncbi:MAG: hypothetical protein IT436_11765 [Phycisphaerales bacterium]|nr:hypothetical protein [Phycisphaerales bacterium]
MTDFRHRRPDVLRRCTLLVMAAGLALAAGCDRDEGAKSVRQASTGMHTITGGATTIVPSKEREKAYTDVINDAKAGIDAGPEAAGAALLLTAQAQLGQADEPLGQYAAAEREYLNRVTVARSHLAAYIEHSSQSSAARQYDPAKDLAEIEKGIATHTASIAEQQKEKAEIDAVVADLQARAKAELDAAAALDTEVAQLREQAARATAVQGETLIKQAAEKRRAADTRRMAGLQLQAQVDVTQPRSAEAGLLVDKFTNQKEDLESTRKEIQDRDAASKQLAASAGAAAAQSAEKLAAEIAEIVKLRTGAIAETSEQARTKLNAAKGNAQKAGAASSSAKTLVGDINQSLAELAWQRAFGHAAFAQLMETLAAAQPPLSDRAKYEADAKAAREEEKKALDEAKEAFDAAKSAYNSAGAKGDAKDRLERLGELLEKSGQRAAGEKLDLLAAFSAKTRKSDDADAARAPETAPGADDLTPTLEMILTSAQQGQYDAIFDHINADTAEKQQMVAALRGALPGLMRLETACKEKFGKGFIEASQQAAGGMGGIGAMGGMGAGGLDQLKNLKVSDFTVNITGDTATVTAPGTPEPMNFTKVDGRWLLTLPDMDMSNPMARMGLKMLEVTGPVFGEVAAEVENGTLQSIEAVTVSLTQKLQTMPEFLEMMQQMQQQLQPGGPK